MYTRKQVSAVGFAIAIITAGCAPAAQPRLPGGSQDSALSTEHSRAPKRLVAAIRGDPPTLNDDINSAGAAGGVPGGSELQVLVSSGLTVEDDRGVFVRQLAEVVPTVENGLWRVLPDGQMETTWKIRPGIEWHDGVPFTAADLIFSAHVGQDKDIAMRRDLAYDFVASVAAPDPLAVVVTWKRPFIQADTLFSTSVVPRHLLERPFAGEKASFAQLPYWTLDFIGTGPYVLGEWVSGSHVILQAFDRYPLGRPKIDQLEVRFIPDANTLTANLLAGTVELTLGRGLSLDQGTQVADQWRDGKMVVALSDNWIAAFPQLLSPSPRSVGDVRFRRALLHGLDRQELADTFQQGLVRPAHSYLSPSDPMYGEVEDAIVRYEYDPRRAIQLIEGIGHQRGADGFFSPIQGDTFSPSLSSPLGEGGVGGGQRLAVEVRVVGSDLNQKATLAVADYWQRIGVETHPLPIPPQRARDAEWRANFPGFEVAQQPNGLMSTALRRFHGMEASLPENSFRGNNRTRYMSRELDGAIDRYFVTIPRAERTQAVRQIIHHLTDQVIAIGLLYNAQPTLVANRLRHVPVRTVWNVHEWDTVS